VLDLFTTLPDRNSLRQFAWSRDERACAHLFRAEP